MNEIPTDMKSLFDSARAALEADESEVQAVRRGLVAALPKGTVATPKTGAAFVWLVAGSALILLAVGLSYFYVAPSSHRSAKNVYDARSETPPQAAAAPSQAIPAVLTLPAPAPTARQTEVRAERELHTQRVTRPSPEDETRLLIDAQRACRDGNFARAMSDVQRHARLYPQSTLAKERDALRLIATCALHNSDEARARIGEFDGTPYAIRIRNACDFE